MDKEEREGSLWYGKLWEREQKRAYTVVKTPDEEEQEAVRPLHSEKTRHSVKYYVIIAAIVGIELVLCFALIVLASLWKHWFGIGLGASAILCASLLSIVMKKKPHRLPIIGTFAIFLSWIGNFALFLLVILSIAIHIAGSDPNVNSFPLQCRKLTNCVLVTSYNTTNAQGFSVPQLNTTVDETTFLLQNYWGKQYGGTLLNKIVNATDTFLHYRTLTYFWGFPDDTYLEIFCNESKSEVWILGESRLGTGDYGENHARISKFLNTLNTTEYTYATCL